MDGTTFVTGLLEEMEGLFAELGEHETLEAESDGDVEVVTLLQLALKSELEASELAGAWMPSTPEIDAKALLAKQCGDEMKHFRLISHRLEELGEEPGEVDFAASGYSPLYEYLVTLRSTVERVAAGPFAREAIAKVRNEQFIDYCRSVGDTETARLYVEVIQPEEIEHHEQGRRFLERHCVDEERQEPARSAVRRTLAIADELRTLAEKRTGAYPIPAS